MKINVTRKEEVEVDIDVSEALRILCKTLDIDFILDDTLDLWVAWDSKLKEYFVMKDNDIYDDRGELYIVLRRLITLIVPNCELYDPIIRNIEKIEG